jgi:hypothetical protein
MPGAKAGAPGPKPEMQPSSLTLAAAGEAPSAPEILAPAEMQRPINRITLAGPPDRATRALSGLDKRLVDGTSKIDDAIKLASSGLDTGRLAADPVLGDLRNARTFLPMARKAGLTARAALLGPEPDFTSADKAVKDQQAWLSRASYLLHEAFRLVAPANPLRLAIAQLDAELQAGCRDAQALLADIRRAASRAG